MSIAVVVVTYDSNSTIARCLDAIRAQTTKPSRVLIIDNASPSGFSKEIADCYPAFEFTYNGENTGFAAANNQAVALLESDASIEFVAMLNPDAFAAPTWLEEMYRAAREYPECDAFASRMMLAGSDVLADGLGDVYHISGLAWRARHRKALRAEDLTGREVFGVCAGAGFYRLSALRDLGGFDVGLFCYLEDVDLSFRMQRLGRRCRYVPRAVVSHIGGVSTRDNAAFRLYHGHRNMIIVFFKNMPIALLLLALPLHIAVNLVGIFRGVWRRDASVVLRAKWDGIRALGSVFRQRARLHPTPTVGSRGLLPRLSVALVRN